MVRHRSSSTAKTEKEASTQTVAVLNVDEDPERGDEDETRTPAANTNSNSNNEADDDDAREDEGIEDSKRGARTSSASAAASQAKVLEKRKTFFQRTKSIFSRESDDDEARTFEVSSNQETNYAKKFKGNAISTAKYNVATFLPKGLYEQFRRVANMYFLSVATVACFPSISPIKPLTMWVPLTFIITLSMAKEAVEDYKRHRQDNEQNTTPIERFNGKSMQNCEWKDLVCGDVVRVVRDAFFPADLIQIGSSNDEKTCYVETKNLDGETNLKLKRSVDIPGIEKMSDAKKKHLEHKYGPTARGDAS